MLQLHSEREIFYFVTVCYYQTLVGNDNMGEALVIDKPHV
jgi:hypothetical protein